MARVLQRALGDAVRGRVIAFTVFGPRCAVVLLMIGVATATVAHWIITEVAKADDGFQSATVAHIEELRAEIKTLQQLVQDRLAEDGSRQTPVVPTVPRGSG